MVLSPVLLITLAIHLYISSATLFQARGLTGFDIDIDVGPTTTTVIATIPQSFPWRGIGFGGSRMRNTYAIIVDVDFPSTPNFYEYRLGDNTQGTLLDDAATLNWGTSFALNGDGTIDITLTRANDLALGPFYYTFDPADTTLDIIYAVGSNQYEKFALSAGHSASNYVCM